MEILSRGSFINKMPMVLASASPRRQALLAAQGLYFKVIPCLKREPGIEDHESEAAYVVRLASWKAGQVCKNNKTDIFLAADTIVCLDGRILGKPSSAKQALEMLVFLRGREHYVYSGVCILNAFTGAKISFASRTRVEMANFDDSVLRAYVLTGEPMDKAGAYAVQGNGTFLVSKVSGSYTNVVGLPVSRTIRELLAIKAIAPRTSEESLPEDKLLDGFGHE